MSTLFVIAAVGFGLFALVLPVTRMRVRHGHTGIAVSKTLSQRLVGGGLFGAITALALFTGAVAIEGPAGLGVVALPHGLGAMGFVVAIGGTVLVVTAQYQMGRAWRIGIDETPTDLVSEGLYRYTRNPIYTGAFVFLTGLGLMVPSPILWGLILFTIVLIATQVRFEEHHLLGLHGDSYARYARQVGRFVPGVGRL